MYQTVLLPCNCHDRALCVRASCLFLTTMFASHGTIPPHSLFSWMSAARVVQFAGGGDTERVTWSGQTARVYLTNCMQLSEDVDIVRFVMFQLPKIPLFIYLYIYLRLRSENTQYDNLHHGTKLVNIRWPSKRPLLNLDPHFTLRTHPIHYIAVVNRRTIICSSDF